MPHIAGSSRSQRICIRFWVCDSFLFLYTYEFIHFFGITSLARVGTCGAVQEDTELYDRNSAE